MLKKLDTDKHKKKQRNVSWERERASIEIDRRNKKKTDKKTREQLYDARFYNFCSLSSGKGCINEAKYYQQKIRWKDDIGGKNRGNEKLS